MSKNLVIDGLIFVNWKNNEDFSDALTMDAMLQLNRLISKFYKADIELKLEYKKLKNPLVIKSLIALIFFL